MFLSLIDVDLQQYNTEIWNNLILDYINLKLSNLKHCFRLPSNYIILFRI